MCTTAQKHSTLLPLPQLARPTIADQEFRVLQDRIFSLELPRETKISEAGVSTRIGVSRQAARDPVAAAEAIDKHLSRILVQIDTMKARNHDWFTGGAK